MGAEPLSPGFQCRRILLLVTLLTSSVGGVGRTEAKSSYSTSLSIRCFEKGKFRENISHSHWNHLDTLTVRKSVQRVFRKNNVLQYAKHDISPVI
jgi:hypothetical protein